MNERIREFAKQTGYIWHASGDPQVYEFTPEKLAEFAELIVRECAELCLKHAEYEGPFNQMEFRKGQHFYTIIKNHFGVE